MAMKSPLAHWKDCTLIYDSLKTPHASFNEKDVVLVTLLVAETKSLTEPVEGRKGRVSGVFVSVCFWGIFLAHGLSGCNPSQGGTAVGTTGAGHVASSQEAEGDEP